ncbi:Protein of uncharacterised function (DUF2633) [Yersinia nurmii]|uniref:Protein of uncharacterized function (DUF2633) n=2 Tax=Yersinia nurmii TaxID=685706 RepID=A0ABP1YB97_9GAMM|nr:Protein of uncharacterised function (DUF2633) [Yersinia nurmii]
MLSEFRGRRWPLMLTSNGQHSAKTSMRNKKSTQLTKIILLVSFIILFGRLLYAAIAAIPHHQERNQSEQIEQPVDQEYTPPQPDLTP